MDATKFISLQARAYDQDLAACNRLEALRDLQIFCNENDIETGITFAWTGDPGDAPSTYGDIQTEIDALEYEITEQ